VLTNKEKVLKLHFYFKVSHVTSYLHPNVVLGICFLTSTNTLF
jgi:hypothetical protein